MYFNHRLFLRALALALFRMPFRLKRWAYVILFSGLFLLSLAVIVLGRALDHIFFPRFRRQPVSGPVFIVAPPRSGTTLLQNLLSLDEQRFVHLKLYQTIFPSVCYQRLCGALVGLDRYLGSPIARLMAWCERKWFGGWDDMHRLRLSQPEEDGALLLYAFESEAIFMLFPFVDELWQAGFPDALPPGERRKLMRYYRSCLQRHLYANGPDRTLLSKCSQSAGMLQSLLEEFPDARFINIVRHPDQSVASHVSLFVPIWQSHSPEIARDGPVAKAYARLAVEWYKNLFAFRKSVDPSRYYCIDYRDLSRDPGETVERLYAHFGWSLSDAFRRRLADATRRQRQFKSKHEYTLEEFGVSKAWIRQELGDLIAAYDLGEEDYPVPELPASRDETGTRDGVATAVSPYSHLLGKTDSVRDGSTVTPAETAPVAHHDIRDEHDFADASARDEGRLRYAKRRRREDDREKRPEPTGVE